MPPLILLSIRLADSSVSSVSPTSPHPESPVGGYLSLFN